MRNSEKTEPQRIRENEEHFEGENGVEEAATFL